MMDDINKYWQVYQRALIPKTPPHQSPPIKQLSSWYLLKRGLLFARWEEEFDCGYETEWYHVIKDDVFDISKLNSNRRYKITKGKRYFYCKIIDKNDFANDIYNVTLKAFSAYPAKYRPTINKKKFIDALLNKKEENVVYVGCFDRAKDVLCGYAELICDNDYVSYSVHKVIPEEEKRQVNASLVCGVLDYFESIDKYRYIDDGAKNIRHETNFQGYLRIYFGFRKAYGKLNIIYNPILKMVVYLLYPFKSILIKLDNFNMFHNINSVLEQERIRRSFL